MRDKKEKNVTEKYRGVLWVDVTPGGARRTGTEDDPPF